MEGLLTLDNLFTLVMLIFLQIVLGFDNLLYISIESKRVRPDKQSYVRKMGLGLAILFRLVLLFVILAAVDQFQSKLFGINISGIDQGIVQCAFADCAAGGTVYHLYSGQGNPAYARCRRH